MTSIRLSTFVERYALVVLLGLIFLFFTIDSATPQFATTANLNTILANQAVLGILVVATVIPLVAGHIDLSIGPNAALSSMFCAGFMSKAGSPLGVAIVIAVAAAIGIGVINGILVSGVGINSIVATLGTSSMVGAGIDWYSGGVTIVNGISTRLTDIGAGNWFGLPKPFWFLVVVALGVWYVLEHTPVGRYLYSVGASPRAAELVGLRVRRFGFGGFVVAGALAGVAGVLLVAVQGGGNPQLSQSFTLPALAAAFLGATAIKPGRYNVTGAIVAIFLLAVSVNGLTLLGAQPWVSDMFNGAALLAGVGISVYSGRRRQSRPTDRGGRTGTAAADPGSGESPSPPMSTTAAGPARA